MPYNGRGLNLKSGNMKRLIILHYLLMNRSSVININFYVLSGGIPLTRFIIHFPNVIFCDIQTSKSGYFAISRLVHEVSQITVLFNA